MGQYRAILLPCIRCGQRLHILDALFKDADGPYCFECWEAQRRVQMRLLKSSSRFTALPAQVNLLQTLLAIGVIGLILSAVIPTFLRINDSSEAQELRTLFTAYHNTETGRAARQLINLSLLRQAGGPESLLVSLKDKRQLEALLAGQDLSAQLDQDALKALLASRGASQELTDASGLGALLLPQANLEALNKQRVESSLSEAIQEAAALALVRQERMPEFNAQITKAMDSSDYQTQVGAVIKVIQDWQAQGARAR